MSEQDKKIKVLIVEDCKLTTISLKTSLKKFDFIEIINSVENGELAIEAIKKSSPDIVLMDIGMPVMDGIKATQEIKNISSKIKIIMLTTHSTENQVFDALSAGAHSYCLKDIDVEELSIVIKSTYNGASWLDPSIARTVLCNVSKRQQNEQEIYNLTDRELEILNLIAQGYSNAKISETLHISMNTVKTHIKNIFQKLEVEDRTEAAMKAFKSNLI